MLQVGDMAPDFALPDAHGTVFRLGDQRGKWVVVYFYPKDDTPGCTVEACSFRDALPEFEGLDAQVFGISTDDQESHLAFSRKYGLNFPILADPERRAIDAYGAFGEKVLAGHRYEGTYRHSFLVAPDGRIARVWREVDPERHADEVRLAIAELSGDAT